MKLYILTDGEIVTEMRLSAEPLEGWIETNLTEYPNTASQDGCTVEVLYRDGKVEVVQVPIPPKTEEALAEERKRAYEAECDGYLIAYQGYLLEGNEEAAENCRQAYLAKKAEIRARIK